MNARNIYRNTVPENTEFPLFPSTAGFTLVEMSIVLVVLGLIIGGFLVGQDVINAAATRAQLAQIEKYENAVIAFQSKYGYLPGDIPDPSASNFGFQGRGQYDGEGDGDGTLRGNCQNIPSNAYNHNFYVGCGETAVFWEDLSTAGLIDTAISGCDVKGVHYPCINGAGTAITLNSTPAALKDWLPTAKIGTGDFIYVYNVDSQNYFALSSVTKINYQLASTANPGITVQQAYNMDKKIDDGLPQSGSVNTCYLNNNIHDFEAIYAAGGQAEGASGGTTHSGSDECNASTTATPPLTTDCFGNNNTAGTMTYSVSTNANLQNCALSFAFQ